jgi:peptidyl-prolyl cis-trans isomerase SurA
MKRVLLHLFLWILTVLSLTPQARGQQPELLDYIVAVVDNDVILYSDILEMSTLFRMQNPKNAPPDLEKQLLDRMIDMRAMIAAARRDSLQIPVDQIDNNVRQFTDQLREGMGSQEALEKEVAESGMSLRDWTRLIRQQKEEELLQRKLEEERFGQVRVTGFEVEEFFRTQKDSIPIKPVTVGISHIMMSIKPDQEKEARLRARIDEIARLLKEGGDFADMARQYSEDLASAQKGGDLGFFSRGTFVREFEEAAFPLPVGGVSEPVRTNFGYHIIRKEEEKGDQIRARHIFVQVPVTPEDEARVRGTLAFLRQRILEGHETFEEAAAKYSEDIESSNRNGSLGEFFLNQLQPQYQTVLDTMTVGSLSAPIRVEDAEPTLHLIRLDSKSGGHKLTLEKDFEEISILARQHKWRQERERWMSDLKRNLHIDIRGIEPES